MERPVIRADAFHRLEKLRPIHQPPLMIDAPIYKIGIIQRQLRGSINDMIRRLHAQHKAVVLVPHLVPPAAKSTAGVDVFFLQLGQKLLEHALALERGSGVPVVEAAVVCANDLIGGFQHLGGNQATDAVLEEGGVVDRLHA